MAAETRFLKEDNRWIRQMFLTEPGAFDEFIISRRTATSNFYKYEDTTLGGNRAMNPPAQYTRYCDPKGERLFEWVSRGMGDYYSEAIDDNARTISMRFGTPEYTGLVSFFSSFYNSDAGMLVRTGKSGSLFYDAGKLAGYVAILPFMPFILIGKTLKTLAGTPSTRFYYLRPNMPIYWNAVQSFANRLAANLGFGIPQQNSELAVARRDAQGMPVRNPETNEIIYEKINFDTSGTQFDQYAKMIPSLWTKNGSIDIYSLSTRAQRLADIWNEALAEVAASTALVDDEAWRTRLTQFPGSTHREMINALTGTPLKVALTRWFNSPAGENATDPDGKDSKREELLSDAGVLDKFKTFALAEARDGAQFVTFYVHEAGTSNESFSNSTRTPDIGEKFNSISSGVRMARVNMADGKTGIGVVDAAVSAATAVVKGAIDGVQMSGLMALAGNAMTDIPKVWDSSTASLPRMDYTLQLRTLYGNKFSRFQRLLLPLAMILVGGLPRSAGAQSYGTPFLVELYDKGRAQTRLGLIESISVTRGVGNIGWTRDDEPLGFDVQFTVADLSSIMHVPLGTTSTPFDMITPGGLNRAFFGDDTAFTDYLAVLSSLGLADQIYKTRQMARNWRRVKLEFDSYFSVSHAASWFGGSLTGRVISALSNVRAVG